MIWLLTVCTSGWIMCGSIRTAEYPDETSCYTALETLYRSQGRDAFNYILCSPKSQPGSAGGEA